MAMVNGESHEISLIQSILDSVGVHGWEHLGAAADLIGLVMFGLLCLMLVRSGLKKVEG
jgi:hypothetical protein